MGEISVCQYSAGIPVFDVLGFSSVLIPDATHAIGKRMGGQSDLGSLGNED